MMKFLAVALLATALAGCGNGGDAGSNTNSSLGTSFDNGFRTSFRTKFIDQCIAGAKSTAGANVDFSVICGCTADKLLGSKSVTQLMAGPSKEELEVAAKQCVAEHPIKR